MAASLAEYCANLSFLFFLFFFSRLSLLPLFLCCKLARHERRTAVKFVSPPFVTFVTSEENLSQRTNPFDTKCSATHTHTSRNTTNSTFTKYILLMKADNNHPRAKNKTLFIHYFPKLWILISCKIVLPSPRCQNYTVSILQDVAIEGNYSIGTSPVIVVVREIEC